jgi:toxin FitB
MILLDTNVVSALMRREPDSKILAWLDRQPRSSVWITSITAFEIRFGLASLPAGRRRAQLMALFERMLAEILEERIRAFDTDAAQQAAELMAARRKAGRPVDLRDTMIAGIALAARATLVTGNTRHFADLPIAVIDPWA